MSSKQRDEIRNLNRTMDAYRHENDALAERLHRALTERDDLRDQLAQAIAEREEMAEEVVAVRAELARSQATVRDLTEEAVRRALTTTPEPRPFRVGDRVRVAEGATYQTIGDQVAQSWVGGRTGRVRAIAADEDLYVETDDADGAEGHASPEFCTLIEAESEVVLPLPEGYTFTAPESNTPAPPEPTRTGVTLHTHDGRELWIPSEESVDVEVDNGLLWLTTGISGATVAYVNPAAIVAAVVTR